MDMEIALSFIVLAVMDCPICTHSFVNKIPLNIIPHNFLCLCQVRNKKYWIFVTVQPCGKNKKMEPSSLLVRKHFLYFWLMAAIPYIPIYLKLRKNLQIYMNCSSLHNHQSIQPGTFHWHSSFRKLAYWLAVAKVLPWEYYNIKLPYM